MQVLIRFLSSNFSEMKWGGGGGGSWNTELQRLFLPDYKFVSRGFTVEFYLIKLVFTFCTNFSLQTHVKKHSTTIQVLLKRSVAGSSLARAAAPIRACSLARVQKTLKPGGDYQACLSSNGRHCTVRLRARRVPPDRTVLKQRKPRPSQLLSGQELPKESELQSPPKSFVCKSNTNGDGDMFKECPFTFSVGKNTL